MKPKSYDFFVSYSSKDRIWVDGLIARLTSELRHPLEDRELLIFRDRQDMRAGFTWVAHVRQALENSRFLLAIISKNYFNSVPSRRELHWIESRDLYATRGVVLPVSIDDSAIAKDLSGDRVYRDFSNALDFNSPAFAEVFNELKADILNILSTTGDEPVLTEQQQQSLPLTDEISLPRGINIERFKSKKTIITSHYEEVVIKNPQGKRSAKPDSDDQQ